jgi:rhodanese-related sulfurtransferase
MNAVGQLAAIVGISLSTAAGTFWIKGPPLRTYFCDPASLKPDEVCLQQLSPAANILWVDARLRKDWQKNGLAGSVLWNLDPSEDMQAFEAEIALRIMETPQVIVYCGDENCGLSRQIAERIRGLQLGAEVSVLRGGWSALRDAGRITLDRK